MLLGWACFLTGRWPEAQARLQHAHALMDSAGGRQHYLYEILLPHFRANVAMASGRLDDAQAIFERALANAPFHAPIWLNHDLARCLLMRGDPTAAHEAMARSLAAHSRFRCIICGCQANGVAAEFYATVGDMQEAESHARDAEETARSIGHVTTRMRIARARARIDVRRAAPEDAIAIAREALALGAELPVAQPFEAALTQWVLGDAHQAAGDRQAAHAAWSDARETFTVLGASWHLQQIEALMSRA
jgi:tetratricopeptide (TPR) repeat protein